MAYVKSDEVVVKMIEAGVAKGQLPVTRKLLSGASPPPILKEQFGAAQE